MLRVRGNLHEYIHTVEIQVNSQRYTCEHEHERNLDRSVRVGMYTRTNSESTLSIDVCVVAQKMDTKTT